MGDWLGGIDGNRRRRHDEHLGSSEYESDGAEYERTSNRTGAIKYGPSAVCLEKHVKRRTVLNSWQQGELGRGHQSR